jgi:hypothetical protein
VGEGGTPPPWPAARGLAPPVAQTKGKGGTSLALLTWAGPCEEGVVALVFTVLVRSRLGAPRHCRRLPRTC